MSETKELVERLRQLGEWLDFDFGSDERAMGDIAREGAAALEAAVAETAALIDGSQAVLPHTVEHAEKLYLVAVASLKTFGRDPEAADLIERLEARAEAAEAERDALAKALEPFLGDATMEQLLWGDMPDDATGTVTVQLRHFRRAREALSTLTKEPGNEQT